MGLYLYRRHLTHGFGLGKKEPCPHSADRFLKKGDRCPVWVEGVDPQGVYHRKSLKTTSWDIGETIRLNGGTPLKTSDYSLSGNKIVFTLNQSSSQIEVRGQVK